MVTVRQVGNPIDTTFKAGFIGDCDAMTLVREYVTILFSFKNVEHVYARSKFQK